MASTPIDGLSVHWAAGASLCKNVREFVCLFNLCSRVPMTSDRTLLYLKMTGFNVTRSFEQIKKEYHMSETTATVMVLEYHGHSDVTITPEQMTSSHTDTKIAIKWQEVSVLKVGPTFSAALLEQHRQILDKVDGVVDEFKDKRSRTE